MSPEKKNSSGLFLFLKQGKFIKRKKYCIICNQMNAFPYICSIVSNQNSCLMPISYDKKGLKKSKKYLNMGKKKYALIFSFYWALFQAVFVAGVLSLMDEKFSINKFILFLVVLFVSYSIFGYFMNLKNWERMKSLYYESIEYFKENDPEFIKDILEENLNNDK